MGEAKQRESATRKLIALHPLCALCGGNRSSETREHIPATALFDSSHRPNDIIVPACRPCNGQTSTADLVVAIISRWHLGSAGAHEEMDHRRLVSRLRRQAPLIIQEWMGSTLIERKEARRHLEAQGVPVPLGAGMVTVGPHTIRQVNLFAHKIALGLYFKHFGEGLPAGGRVQATWWTKEDVVAKGLPPVAAMLPKLQSASQGKWTSAGTFEYRYDMNPNEHLFGFLARFRRRFFVFGVVVRDGTRLPEDDGDWIAPGDLLQAASVAPRFAERH